MMMTSTDDQFEASAGSSIGLSTTVKQKTTLTAYLLGIPLGFTGAHHFYLGNYSLGFSYLMTLGLAGLGWVADWFRMGSLVADANRANEARWRWENEQGGLRDENVLNYMTDNRKLMDCYLMVFVTGVLGSHQFYLKRYGWGIAYMLTLGLGGAGYIMDWFRLPRLHRRYKDGLKAKSEGVEQVEKFYHLDDAYACCITLGIFGFHRFYLGQSGWGLVYLLTLGLFGWGWLFDMIRMKWLVEKINKRIWLDEENRRLLAGQQAPTMYTGGCTHVATQPTYVDKSGATIAPPAATMHGYYFPSQSHLSSQAPGYQSAQQQPQFGPGIPPSDGQTGQGLPPPPYTPVADVESAMPEQSAPTGASIVQDAPPAEDKH